MADVWEEAGTALAAARGKVAMVSAEFEGERYPLQASANRRPLQSELPIVDEVGTCPWPRAEEIRRLLPVEEPG